MEAASNEITWVVFKGEFLKRYFPEDVCGKKEIEFLELKQGNSIIVEYVAKFEELVIFCPHYNDAIAEVSKCIKFENWLCPKIKQGIRYREIRRFLELVNKCIIYDEDSRVRSSHYKSLSEKRGRRLNCEKLYSVLANKGKQRILDGRRPSGGGLLLLSSATDVVVQDIMLMNVKMMKRNVSNVESHDI